MLEGGLWGISVRVYTYRILEAKLVLARRDALGGSACVGTRPWAGYPFANLAPRAAVDISRTCGGSRQKCTFLPRQEEGGAPLRSVRRRRRRRRGRRGRRKEGFLRWGVAPLWVKEEEEKGRAPRPHGFCKPTGCLDRSVVFPLSGTKGK